MHSKLVKFLHILLFVVVATDANDGSSSSSSEEEIDYRLNDNIIPSHYEIEITPYLSEVESKDKRQFTFDGRTDISFKTKKLNVKEIVLNVKNLSRITCELKSADENNHEKLQVFILPIDEQTEKLTIKLKNPIIRNVDYILSIAYTGIINTGTYGIFRSSYFTKSGEHRWLAATNLEPTYARLMFPCFDEPQFKATFTLKINRHNSFKSYSNTNINFSIPLEDEDRTIDVFKKTPIMSTFTLAFLVAAFEERLIESNFTILVAPRRLNQTDVAFENSLELLKALEEYTDIPYSSISGIEKMQFGVIPSEYMQSMQNWGLILFSGPSILCDICSGWFKGLIVSTIATELSHMWFANLVTCEWWSYTWLNEGFANYMQKYIINKLKPEWRSIEKFTIEKLNLLSNKEFLQSDVPLTNTMVQSPEETRKRSSSYDKGSAVIRMFEHMLGEENFKRAIRKYLKKFSFKSVTPENLMHSLNEEWPHSKVNFATLFSDWTEQPGLPLITVELDESGTEFYVSQDRYFQKHPGSKKSDLKWTIPIAFTTNVENNFRNTTPDIFLQKTDEKLKVSLGQKANWIIANVQQTGFYRVNYDLNTWKRIENALKASNFSGIHIINRVQIAVDLFKYSAEGYLNYSDALRILEFVRNETDALMWENVLLEFSTIGRNLDQSDFALFSEYMKVILSELYEKLNPATEEHDRWKNFIKKHACYYGIEKCVKKALNDVDEALSDDTNDHFVEVVTAVTHEPDKYFDAILEKIKSLPEGSYPFALIGLVHVPDKEKLLKVLNFGLELTKTKAYFFDHILVEDRILYDVALEFMMSNFKLIIANRSSRDTKYTMTVMGDLVTTEAQFRTYQRFLEEYRSYLEESENEINSVLLKVKRALQWKEKYGLEIVSFIKKFSQNSK